MTSLMQSRHSECDLSLAADCDSCTELELDLPSISEILKRRSSKPVTIDLTNDDHDKADQGLSSPPNVSYRSSPLASPTRTSPVICETPEPVLTPTEVLVDSADPDADHGSLFRSGAEIDREAAGGESGTWNKDQTSGERTPCTLANTDVRQSLEQYHEGRPVVDEGAGEFASSRYMEYLEVVDKRVVAERNQYLVRAWVTLEDDGRLGSTDVSLRHYCRIYERKQARQLQKQIRRSMRDEEHKQRMPTLRSWMHKQATKRRKIRVQEAKVEF